MWPGLQKYARMVMLKFINKRCCGVYVEATSYQQMCGSLFAFVNLSARRYHQHDNACQNTG
ncbi:uncharacterized protein PHALS_14683 [Plasmopara halstedii]|uniref:Uncharacterized protein n=1 Tax=Plasmopara halstedii TaxID=4781 RepID=A0A0P1APE8_PLAHL|nr:uncharacterized protein PHALS_14683 [Plasmopara halstedii]CEG43069.1 hypothetical protein PHALS_14683 [Plasmopara halstedii]|eukprot:XP_024579438.1 hypothetical protein PHALS_14683 [Plasmopara halstedii]